MAAPSMSIAPPAETSLLVAFVDLARFADTYRRLDEGRIASLLDALYERIAEHVDKAGGRVVKFLWDGALIVFPEAEVDRGVAALLDLKAEVDRWLESEGLDSRLVVKAHFGPVIAGPFGGRGEKRFDVMGATVNTAAKLESRAVALSAQAFRKLAPATRRRFKKHTPPITYIPVEARRP